MNNGRNHNSPPPTRSGGNGTATAARRNSPASPRSGSNGAGSRPKASAVDAAERSPAPSPTDSLHWDALAPVVSEALAQPLDPALVSQRKGRGGRSFDYIEGHTAIDQANRIFGFGGWGYELLGDVTLRQIEQVDSRTGEVSRSAAYSAIVRVAVPGAPARSDVGFQPITDDSSDGHETAFKGAVTDALKRALRSFGDRFGNGLYGDPPIGARSAPAAKATAQARSQPAVERGSTQQPRPRVVQPAADSSRNNGRNGERGEDRDARNLRAQLIELSAEQGFAEPQVRSAVEAKTGRPLDDLGPAELNPLIASAAEKLERRRQAALD